MQTFVLELYIRLRYIYSIATVTVWVLHGGCKVWITRKRLLSYLIK